MNWDRTSLRQFILSVLKPLKSGKTVSQDGTNAALDNLFPEGSDDSFRHSSPFGFISRVPSGITAFYDALFGAGYENIVLGHLHKQRPIPLGVGETVVYSTTVNGTIVKASITMKNDGTIEISSPKGINVTGTADITISGNAAVNITAATKVVVACDDIELGEGAVEKIINGETFQTFFNTHDHIGNLGYPVGPPRVLSGPSHLSNVVKAKK